MEPTGARPKWATRLLRWYCKDWLAEEIIGDLEEAYHDRQRRYGKTYAARQHVLDVIRFIRPGVVSTLHEHKQDPPMIKNYFKIALRNLVRRKGYATINITGLVAGLTCALLAWLYVEHESSYDQFHAESEDIYRIVRTYRSQTYSCLAFRDYWQTPVEVQQNQADAYEALSNVEAVTQFVVSNAAITGRRKAYFVENGRKRFVANKILFTNRGNEFLEVFSWNFIQGNPETALDGPGKIVLTQSQANRYFGKQERVIGEFLRIDTTDFTVTGVIDDVPSYSHFDFELIATTRRIPSWGAYFYAKTNGNTATAELSKQISNTYYNLYPDEKDDPLNRALFVQPLEDIHLFGGFLYELKKPGDLRYLYIFGIIGTIILLITCTNYTNLSVAMYVGRQREMGMRKVMGARKNSIRLQFLFEACLLVFITLPVAFLLLELLLPFFNRVMEMELTNRFIREPGAFLLALLLALGVGLLSGLYPSMVLARKSINHLFKDRLQSAGVSGALLRRSLIGLQLVLLIGLGSATVFINKQLNFIQNKDLGYEQEGIFMFRMSGLDNYKYLKNEITNIPGVTGVGSGSVPGRPMYNQITYAIGNPDESLDNGSSLRMSKGLIDLLGIEHPALQALDTGKAVVYLINEKAAKTFSELAGVPEHELVGRTFLTEPEYVQDNGTRGFAKTIDGIVHDFHFFTLREKINPMFIEVRNTPEWINNVVVKADTRNMYEVIRAVKQRYDAVDQEGEVPFRAYFMDDSIESLYEKEAQIGQLSKVLSGVAILLASMGLIGLSAYLINQRRSEISIRKVFGASIREILLLVNREFAIIVVVATVLAAPVVYLGIRMWLQGFAYHIEPQWYYIAAVGLISLLIVLGIVSLQSLKAARTSPAVTLRDE